MPKDRKSITEEQLKAGHGGMYFIMLNRFFNALKNKSEMPIDVYEACAMMCVTGLSEISIKNGSAPIDVPDFTKRKYKNRKTLDVLDITKINDKYKR